MSGSKIGHAKEAAIMAIERLDSQDIVSVITYDNEVNVVVPATKVTDKESIYEKIRAINSDGNTALFAGVSKAANEVRKFITKNQVSRIILLSDGLANVGPSTPSELGQLGASLSKEGVSVTTIGLGLGYNEDLMTQLAGFSDGNHAFVENSRDLVEIFQYELGDVLSVVAQGIDITIECSDTVRPLRILGRDGEIIGNKVHTRLNQLQSEQEKFIILEVEVPAKRANSQLQIAKVNITYNNLYSKKEDSLQDRAIASFSISDQVVKESINQKAYEDSIGQVATETKKQAIELRDEGKIARAQELLQKNAEFTATAAQNLPQPSPVLIEQAEETEADAEALADEKTWNKNRKALKEKVYKSSNQQKY